jgi:pre-mRNA-splicing helicase BRR2
LLIGRLLIRDKYAANSNLVLRADRRGAPREPTGEPETLWGRINPKDFGSNAKRSIDEDKAKRDAKRKGREEKTRKGADRGSKRE